MPVVLELGDSPDVYVPPKESIEEPEPSTPQSVEVAMEPKVSEMMVPSQRDSVVRELRPARSDGPQQPLLRGYNPQKTLGMKHLPEISSQSGSSNVFEG